MKETVVTCLVSWRASSVFTVTQRKGWEEGGGRGVCTVTLTTRDTAGGSGRCRTALICRVRGVFAFICFLARRPVVAQAHLGPGDGHLVRAGGAHLRREVDDAAVALHILKFVLLGGLHIDH